MLPMEAVVSDGNRIFPKALLLEAGFPDAWVSTYAAIVSKIYYHDVMLGVGMRKDSRGAVYTNADAAGLLQVARGLRDNPNGAAHGRPENAICQNDRCEMWMTSHAGPCM
jgi:hypothetical protein